MGSVTKVWGSHTLKAGFDIRQINYETQNTGDILSYNGNTSWTQRIYNVGESTSGQGSWRSASTSSAKEMGARRRSAW